MFTPAPGELIAQRYLLERVIGRGGMGEVWRAHDRELAVPCALKFLLPHLAIDKETRARFLREARAAAQLRSPHAVQVLGAGEHEGTLYLAMELLEGESLAQRLRREGRLDARTTFSIVEQVARALSRAHQANVVHRDLKPDNIWLWREREVFVKVLDFGVAKAQHELGSVRTTTGMLLGTPQYMSPEQANGDPSLDHRSDLWSLAIIVFECLTGKRPYASPGLGNLLVQIVSTPAPKLAEIAPELPLELDAWWTRALARDPADRFQSAEHWVEALRPALLGIENAPAPVEPPLLRPPDAPAEHETPGSVDPLMTTQGSARAGRRRHQRAAGVAGIALLAALSATSLFWRRPSSPDAGESAGSSSIMSVSSARAAAEVPPVTASTLAENETQSRPIVAGAGDDMPDAGARSPRAAGVSTAGRPRGSQLASAAERSARQHVKPAARVRRPAPASAAANEANTEPSRSQSVNMGKRLGF